MLQGFFLLLRVFGCCALLGLLLCIAEEIELDDIFVLLGGAVFVDELPHRDGDAAHHQRGIHDAVVKGQCLMKQLLC